MTDLLSKFITVAKLFSHRSLIHDPIGTECAFVKNKDSPSTCLFVFEDAILSSYAATSDKDAVLQHYFEGLKLKGIAHICLYSCHSVTYETDEYGEHSMDDYLKKHPNDLSKHRDRIEVVSLNYFEPGCEGELIATISRKSDDNLNIITTLSDFTQITERGYDK